ncbi:MAG: alanyl-tRNA editing protein [Marinobacter sp.]|nr:alanyl-tRNA editing protein [Marinobacter sp.]
MAAIEYFRFTAEAAVCTLGSSGQRQATTRHIPIFTGALRLAIFLDRAMRRTIKQYYDEPHLSSTRAILVNLDRDTIELDRTIAFPEGGGQESDTGTITSLRSGRSVRFIQTRRVRCTPVRVSDSHRVLAGGIILHQVHSDDFTVMSGFEVGDEVRIDINDQRRQRLSTFHSASHVLYMGIAEVRPDLIDGECNCHIREDQARFDFRTDTPITQQERASMQRIANQIIQRNSAIRVFADADHPESRYWECEGFVIPCGGTHLERTGTIGELRVQLRNLGRGKERVSCVVVQAS